MKKREEEAEVKEVKEVKEEEDAKERLASRLWALEPHVPCTMQ